MSDLNYGDPFKEASIVSNTQKQMRDDFVGFDPLKWDVVTATGDTPWSFTNGAVLVKGLVSGSSSYLLSKAAFSIPFRLAVGLTMSQRIANQAVRVELVSLDPSTGLPDYDFVARWLFDGTSATTAKYGTDVNGQSTISSGVTVVTTAGSGYFEIEAAVDELWFHCSTVDSTSGRTNTYRKQLKLLDPERVYKVKIDVVNVGVPASATTVTIPFVFVEDYTQTLVEILGGRGTLVPGSATPVALTGTPAVTVSGTPGMSIQPSSSGGGYTSKGKLISAASVNNTLVKASASNVGLFTASNSAASARYLHLYDKVTAPVAGTDVPFHTYLLPASSNVVIPIPAAGLRTTSGFGFSITAGAADTDATAIGAGEVIVNYEYI